MHNTQLHTCLAEPLWALEIGMTGRNYPTPHLRVLQRLHDQHARALAHDEAIAPLVPGAARALRLPAAAAERPARMQARGAANSGTKKQQQPSSAGGTA